MVLKLKDDFNFIFNILIVCIQELVFGFCYKENFILKYYVEQLFNNMNYCLVEYLMMVGERQEVDDLEKEFRYREVCKIFIIFSD